MYLSAHNFTCKVTDDAELLLTLYDAKSGRSFSENFVVRWATSKMDHGWSQTDIFHNFRALFTVIILNRIFNLDLYCYLIYFYDIIGLGN